MVLFLVLFMVVFDLALTGVFLALGEELGKRLKRCEESLRTTIALLLPVRLDRPLGVLAAMTSFS